MVDFVMDAPHVDGGVVEALAYQLAHLLVYIVPLLPRDAVHERNLSPDDEAQRVATRIDVVRLLVVGEAHGRGSHLHNLCQVEVVLLVGQRAAQSPPVLMAGNAVHGILLAVQEEALSCYGFVLAQAQGLYDFVDDLPVLLQARHHLIEIRVLASLPQMGIADLEMGDIALHTLRCQVERLAMRLDQLAFAGIDSILQLQRNRRQRGIVQLHLDRHLGRLLRHILLRDIYTRRCAVVHHDVAGLGHHQPHGTVDTAIDTKQAVVDRYHVGPRRIVGLHHDFILLTILDLCADFADES